MSQPVGEYLRSLFSLEGKVAVLVGGTGVLVGKMAEGLYHAGASVMLVGRSGQKAKAHFTQWADQADRAHFVAADMNEPTAAVSIVKQTLKRCKKIDIWINGAGINAPTPYTDISEEEFQSILSVNLVALHRGCQAIIKHWLTTKTGGNIINVSSMSALRPLSRVYTYSLTKAAVWNLTQNLAREYAAHDIRVNALCPGFFPAEQNRKVLDPGRIKTIMAHTPMDRFGEAEELIGATLLLAAERAGSFITGANLVVDGGFNVVSI